jgi:cyclophilin family peptidyl-prolyl cis-trans isomerase
MARSPRCLTRCASRLAFPVNDSILRRALIAGVVASVLVPHASPAQRATNARETAIVRQWAALLRAHDARSADTAAVDAALASPLGALRAAAARVVGLNRITARYGVLRERVLRDANAATASDAALALGIAADQQSCSALQSALVQHRTGVSAAWALGELGQKCVAFGDALRLSTDTLTRAALLRAAGRWTPFPDSAVASALQSATSADERWSALYAFARARRVAGSVQAVAASTHRDPRIRELAARLLAVTVQTDSGAATAIGLLATLTADTAPHVRIAAVRALASYKAGAQTAVRSRWPQETDRNVRVAIAQAAGAIFPAHDSAWNQWWRSDSTHMVRRSLVTSAWQAEAIQRLDSLNAGALSADPDFRMRVAMLDGAADRAGPRDFSTLNVSLRDPDARVRTAAINGLLGSRAKFSDSLNWRSAALAALRDDDIGVRQAALGSIADSATASDVPLAIDAWERALRDTANDAREGALGIIVNAWKRDSAAFTDSVLAKLRSLTPLDDPQLRTRVTTLTPLAHWRAAPMRMQSSSADYERVVREIVMPSLAGRYRMLRLATARGVIRIALDGVQAPMTVDHLWRLASTGYFNGTRFHRVVPAFVAQGGDPRGDGSGGPGYAIRDELNRSPYVRGAVGMALSGPDTGGSQFFLTLASQPHLDGRYTVFGRVVSGFSALDALVQGDEIQTITFGSR